jgi:hypothetical protein
MAGGTVVRTVEMGDGVLAACLGQRGSTIQVTCTSHEQWAVGCYWKGFKQHPLAGKRSP